LVTCDPDHIGCKTLINVGSCFKGSNPGGKFCTGSTNCNTVTKGGCWNGKLGEMADKVVDAVFCQTDFTTGIGVEAVTCIPSLTSGCCLIANSSVCNRVTACYNGTSTVTCDTSGPYKDYLCGIEKGYGYGNCFGGSSSSTKRKYSNAIKANYYFEAKSMLTIPCWSPVNDTFATACSSTKTACSTNLLNGIGSCETGYYVQESKDSTKYYCTPATGETAGCNMKGANKVVDGLTIRGRQKACYNPMASSSASSVYCLSNQWRCETTSDGIGICTNETLQSTDSKTCVYDSTDSSSRERCNFVNKGGCWDSKNFRVAPYSSGAVYCSTNFDGESYESYYCSPNSGSCCVITDDSQCNKVSSCFINGTSTSCSNNAAQKDFLCGISRTNGQGLCFGGSASANVLFSNPFWDEDYFVASVKDAVITCWDPLNDRGHLCTANQFYCKTDLVTGLGTCGSEGSLPTDTLTESYCSPYYVNTGGCNNWGPIISTLYADDTKRVLESGQGWSCYNPSTGSSISCSSNQWRCKTVNNGTTFLGSCERNVTTTDTVAICSSSDLCNGATKGGCWDAPTGRLAAILNSEAFYCKTDTTTGNTVEDSTCTPGSTTLCCVIGDYSQCNRLSTCPNPKDNNTVSCSTSGPNTDYMCAVKRTDGTGLCIGSSNAYSTISSNLGDWYLTLESKMPCWNPKTDVFINCGTSDFSCKV
jgi:hypothetical protein